MLHGLLLHGAEPFSVRMQLGHQLLEARRMRQRIEVLPEDAHVLAGLLDALLRRAALHVELDLAQAALVRLDLLETHKKLLQFFLVCHSFLLSSF